MQISTAGEGNPPIVFVHGFACDSSDWQPQFDRLRAHNTLVACDLPGHGATPAETIDCSIENYGAEVAQLLADLDLTPAVLVGHSMGCRVVLQSYLNAPERVAGIVLLDGSFTGTGDRDGAEQSMSDHLQSQGYERFIRDFFAEMFVADSDPNLANDIVDRALELPAATGAALLTRLAGWDAAEMSRALDAVHVPLMVIQSTTLSPQRKRVPLSGGQTSPWLELVREHVPTARLEILLGNGHFPHIEAPADVAALIADFVSELPEP